MKLLPMICLLGLTCAISEAQELSFTYHEIGQFGSRMGQTTLVDMDKDGDLDFVFGQRGKLHWYEFQTASKWMLHHIGQGSHH